MYENEIMWSEIGSGSINARKRERVCEREKVWEREFDIYNMYLYPNYLMFIIQ